MHIAVFIKKTTFHKGYGGLETQNKTLCEGLVARGHGIVVFTPKREYSRSEASENGVTYIFVESSYRYFAAKVNTKSWYNRSYREFLKLHSKKPFDLVVSQSAAGIGIIARKQKHGLKVVSIAHGTAMGEFKTYVTNFNSVSDIPGLLLNTQYAVRQFFGRQREYVLQSNKVVAVSNAVKKQLVTETFASEDHIDVIHNGVAPFNLPKDQAGVKAKTLVYSGQMSRDKGVLLLFELANDPRFSGYEMHLVGGGPLLFQLKSKAKELNLGAKLVIHGKLLYTDYIKLLFKFIGAIFLFPTKRIEGFPMSLVEAMLAKMCVVAFDIGGVSDAVDNDVTGALLRFNDVDGFKNKVLELASNQDKLIDMSNKAYKKALTEFSLKTMLDKYEKLFKEVLRT